MFLLILFFPFFSFLVSSCFGRFLGRSGSSFLSSFSIFLSALFSSLAFFEIVFSHSCCFLSLAPWIDSALFFSSWGFLFDSLSILLSLVVSSVSFFVHFFSIGYMSHDPHLQRFLSFLSLFTFFMLLLVTSDNFLLMFLGWEGVGLSSFLLINFWSSRLSSSRAALKALLVNRLGDFSLCLSIFSIFLVFGSVDYSTVFSTSSLLFSSSFFFFGFPLPVSSFICFFLFFGAVGKSAQLGLHTWLPDAMEGPTPVSALIHAATMVFASSLFFSNFFWNFLFGLSVFFFTSETTR